MRATPAPPGNDPLPLLAGRYRVVSTTASDEHGTIHLAWDLRTERWRTLQAARGEAQARKLLGSIAPVRKLDHPAIERVLDLGEEGSVTFAVRERMVGSAADGLPLAPAVAVDLVLRVADALAHAHGHGIVHGHVRPSVVGWGYDGPVVMGWGTPPAVDASTTGRDSELWAHLAPELRQRWRPDARSDVYALGALLYTVLAGRHQADLFAAELLGGALAPLPEDLLGLVIASCGFDPAPRVPTARRRSTHACSRSPARSARPNGLRGRRGGWRRGPPWASSSRTRAFGRCSWRSARDGRPRRAHASRPRHRSSGRRSRRRWPTGSRSTSTAASGRRVRLRPGGRTSGRRRPRRWWRRRRGG